jgi:hypothetical protein
VKALDSGDIAAAEEYLYEIIQGLPTEEAKTHLSIAINGLHYFNDTKGAKMFKVVYKIQQDDNYPIS